MKLKKGERFKDYMGNLCFISYIRLDIVKLSFITENPYTEVWDKTDFLEQLKLNKFFPLPPVKIKRDDVTNHLLEYQLNMVGKTIEQAKELEDWYYRWTITTKQAEMFKSYAIPLIRKIFKVNKTTAEKTFAWFDLGYGLRVKD